MDEACSNRIYNFCLNIFIFLYKKNILMIIIVKLLRLVILTEASCMLLRMRVYIYVRRYVCAQIRMFPNAITNYSNNLEFCIYVPYYFQLCIYCFSQNLVTGCDVFKSILPGICHFNGISSLCPQIKNIMKVWIILSIYLKITSFWMKHKVCELTLSWFIIFIS